ncbi:MAG: right-handed parallel beta-helix repeat-containing protein [Chloroflexota bacterium]
MNISRSVARLLLVATTLWFSQASLCASARQPLQPTSLPQPTSPPRSTPTTTRIPAPNPTSPPVAPSPIPTSLAAAPTTGASYYVAPTGEDANPGTLEEPWQTIQKAADTLLAGDTVYIRAGVYPERVLPQNSGSPGSQITYTAYPGEQPIIDGAAITLPDDLAGLFEISGKSHIRVSGLRAINAGPHRDNAAFLVLDSSDITIQNTSTSNTSSSGIGVWDSQNILIEGNRVELAGVGGGQECITMAISSGFTIRNNTVIDCHKEGICTKDGSSAGQVYGNRVSRSQAVNIYVDAWDKPTHDIHLFQNVASDSIESSGFTVASEMGGLLSNIRLENNIAYHNATYGIEISTCCSASHPMQSIAILNNTLYANGVDWGGGLIADNPQAQDVVLRNNIASQNLTFQIAVAASVPPASLVVDHNLVDGFRGYEDEVYGDDYVEGDPSFTDPASADFHLQAGSPAVDTGSSDAAPLLDFDGDPRPQDGDGDGLALPDIGADERLADTGQLYLPLVVVVSSLLALSFLKRWMWQ